MTDIISKRARGLLADQFSMWTLKEIRDEFEEIGIEEVPDPSFEGGQRRTLVAGYYNSLNFSQPQDARRFVAVATLVLREVERQVEAERAARSPAWSNPLPAPEHPLAHFIGEMRKIGFEWKDNAFHSLSAVARLADTKALAEQFDLAHLGEHIHRIESSIDTDPRQAIGSAKELVETVAKRSGGRCSSRSSRGRKGGSHSSSGSTPRAAHSGAASGRCGQRGPRPSVSLLANAKARPDLPNAAAIIVEVEARLKPKGPTSRKIPRLTDAERHDIRFRWADEPLVERIVAAFSDRPPTEAQVHRLRILHEHPDLDEGELVELTEDNGPEHSVWSWEHWLETVLSICRTRISSHAAASRTGPAPFAS